MISAALLRRWVWMWRSTQLTQRLVLPPPNHLAKGGVHSSTLDIGHLTLQIADDLGRLDPHHPGEHRQGGQQR